MKILVYGSKGWIGNQFIDILEKNGMKYSRGKSRVDDKVQLLKNYNEKIEIIINLT